MSGDKGVEGTSESVAQPPAGVAVGARIVFVSYASPDAEVAKQICQFLESHGVSCWMAPRDVKPGAVYADAIVRAINEANSLVLVLSANATASAHVGREVERAASKRKHIVAFRVDGAPLSPELEYFLSRSQWIDVPALGMAGALVKLAEAVGQGSAAAQANPGLGGGGAAGRGSINQAVGTAAVAKRVVVATVVVIVLGVGGVLAVRFWQTKQGWQTPAVAVIADKSIAVLPFADMSEKKDQEYFSDGMAEEIIDLLVKIPELVVPARTSSFYFKGKSTQIPEIAKQLGVRNILEGSVRKSGSHFRVTAQLVRADNGYHLWSETYDSNVDDVFKTQDEIAGAVVRALKVSLLGKEVPTAKLTNSSEAYELYLQAKSLIYRGNSDDSLKAYADLQKAVTLDPQFALAWATLANLLTHDNVSWDRVFEVSAEAILQFEKGDLQSWGAVWEQARAAAHAAADRAITLGPDLAESHAAMAQVMSLLDWNWKGADAEMRRARELDPGNARITLAAADLTGDLGRIPEAIQLATRAKAQDPLGDDVLLGWLQYAGGALEQADLSLQRVLELYPTADRVHFRRAVVFLGLAKPAKALSEIELEPLGVFHDVGRPLALDALGRRAEASQALALAEKNDGYGMAYQIAYVYAARKDVDRTFYWLERAYQQHDDGLSDLKIDPYFKSLRNEPRYKALLHKVGLPDD
jgi:adenylate cyclase